VIWRIANDAATLPAGLHRNACANWSGIRCGLPGYSSATLTFSAIVFGAGDFRTRTEDRPLPPALAPGDRPRARTALGHD
jgi:S-adenosylmethionine:tRNA ribosyltransferase-isomerase